MGRYRNPTCRYRSYLSIHGSLWLLLFAGCGAPHDEITTYVVAKRADSPPIGEARLPGRDGPRDRMLAAIVLQGERAWFFKLVAPEKRVAKHAAQFEAFIRSVKFTGGAAAPPQWDVPAEWHEQAGSGMRFATFKLDAELPPLELTVIPLPVKATDPEEAILSNVNRWRGQMGLAPLPPDQLANETKRIPLDGPIEATLVNLVGDHRRTMP
ncbi:MAG: hypothetical protein ACC645_15765 [Pirellulales bacterium]